MAQHSCCPNSVTSYVGESAMLRATQDLAAGQCRLCVFLTDIMTILLSAKDSQCWPQLTHAGHVLFGIADFMVMTTVPQHHVV